jgi:hypothetical protein
MIRLKTLLSENDKNRYKKLIGQTAYFSQPNVKLEPVFKDIDILTKYDLDDYMQIYHSDLDDYELKDKREEVQSIMSVGSNFIPNAILQNLQKSSTLASWKSATKQPFGGPITDIEYNSSRQTIKIKIGNMSKDVNPNDRYIPSSLIDIEYKCGSDTFDISYYFPVFGAENVFGKYWRYMDVNLTGDPKNRGTYKLYMVPQEQLDLFFNPVFSYKEAHHQQRAVEYEAKGTAVNKKLAEALNSILPCKGGFDLSRQNTPQNNIDNTGTA